MSDAIGGAGRSEIFSATKLLEAISMVSEILDLDELWSGYLDRALNEEPRAFYDTYGLILLAERLDEGILRASQAAIVVREEIVSRGEESLRVGARVLEDSLNISSDFWSIEWDSESESLTRYLSSACNYVQRTRRRERQILAAKVDQILAGSIPDSDLTDGYRCALNLVALGAGCTLAAAGTVGTLGVVPSALIGFLGSGSTAVLRWEKFGCAKLWRSRRLIRRQSH